MAGFRLVDSVVGCTVMFALGLVQSIPLLAWVLSTYPPTSIYVWVFLIVMFVVSMIVIPIVEMTLLHKCSEIVGNWRRKKSSSSQIEGDIGSR